MEIVRRGYERLAELGSPDLAFLDSEVEWYGPREFPHLAEPHYGHDGVRRYVEKVNEAFDDYRMVPEEFIDAGAAIRCWSSRGKEGEVRAAEQRSRPTPRPTSGRFVTAMPSACRATGIAPTPSKPSDFRSRTSQENVEVVRAGLDAAQRAT